MRNLPFHNSMKLIQRVGPPPSFKSFYFKKKWRKKSNEACNFSKMFNYHPLSNTHTHFEKNVDPRLYKKLFWFNPPPPISMICKENDSWDGLLIKLKACDWHRLLQGASSGLLVTNNNQYGGVHSVAPAFNSKVMKLINWWIALLKR